MKFNEIKYEDKDSYTNLMVVDGLNLAFRYKHAKTKDFSAKYVSTIISLANSYQANKVIVLGDGGSSYRKEIYPEYKANRDELRESQTKEEAQEFKDFIEEFNKAMQILNNNYLTMRFKGIEADDIAAFITNNYSDKFEHIWLISSDKDWDLLVNDNISRFSYVTRKEVTKNNWKDHYPYNIENHIDIKVLQGDKGDNIKGCDGIGEKRAFTLVSKYGSALDIYDSLPLPGKQKFIANLNNFADTILLNYELMDLITYSEQALGDNLSTIIDKIEEYIKC